MDKRTFKRIPANIKVKFFSGTTVHNGTITNLSEKGMFISTEVSFPLKPQLEVLIPLKKELLKVPVEIRSFGMSDDMYSGIGVQLLKQSRNYLTFIDSLRSAR
jgi:hypothetical protein